MSEATRQAGDTGFPVGLCVAGLAVNGLGLAGAVMGAEWGAAAPRGDALGLSWVYVNVALSAGWFLVWPMFALRRGGGVGARGLGWDLAALGMAAMPALGMGGWLAESSWGVIGRTLVLQGSLGAFVYGVLALRGGGAGRRGLIAGALAVMYLALPMVVYLQAEFMPRSEGAEGWWAVVPGLAVRGAALGQAVGTGWWVAVGYGLVGVALWWWGRRVGGEMGRTIVG